jgi:undecaprenyl-diphosphatase
LGAVLVYIGLTHYCTGIVCNIGLLVCILLGGFVCVQFAPSIIEKTSRKDPGEVVADEFAGQALAFFVAALFGFADMWTTVVWVFLLFRVFDIVKPYPCRKLETLKGGWGILADDLAAGLYAGLAFQLFVVLGLTEWVNSFFRSGEHSLSVGYASLLGVIQGLTEFLPVSSSGHLVLFEHLNPQLSPDSPEMLLFDLAIHVGTVAAILAVYRKSILGLLSNLRKTPSYGSRPVEIYSKSPSVRLLVLCAVATVTTVALYKLFKEPLESSRNLKVVCIGLLAAVIVGAAQAAAILPGISRSGATICAAILLGLHRKWAVEFSFLISIPAILGAALLKFIEDYAVIGSGNLSFEALAAGMILSFLVGIVALKMLIRTSRRRRLKYFAAYCYILAIFVYVYLL